MPTPDLEIIQTALAAVLSSEEDKQGRLALARLDPRPGTLTAQPPKTWLTAEEAWREFCALDGPGWLQNTHTTAILHGNDLSQQLARCGDAHWPVAGERASADGQTSLHLRRTAAGWELTTLTEANAPDGLLLTHRLLSADLKEYLVYHVAYRPERVGNHEELRPCASRFVGFEPATDQPAQSTTAPSPSAT